MLILTQAVKEIWQNNLRHLPLVRLTVIGLGVFLSLPVLLPTIVTIACLMVPFRLFSKATIGWCTCKTRMEGKTVLMTGATSGIGYEAAIDLARRGARLILAVRNTEKAKKVSDDILRSTGNNDVIVKYVDLANMKSVRKFSEEIIAEESRIDVLINNAGNAAWEKIIELTDEGLEYQMASNYFGHFLMTNLIIDLVKRATPSRIINTSSMVHWRPRELDLDNLDFQKGGAGYWNIYGTTKLCMMLFTRELARRLKNQGVTANCLHPGVVDTPIYDRQPAYMRILAFLPRKLLFRTPREGAQTIIHLAVAPELQNTTGLFFAECKPTKWYSSLGGDMVLAKRLWDRSVDIVGLAPDEGPSEGKDLSHK